VAEDIAVGEAKPTVLPPAETWGQRLVRGALYGRKDRGAKARARIGLLMIAFICIYGIIAGRLISYAIVGNSRGILHRAADDAVAIARPDVTDRNGQILATDVTAESLYGEPHRIIDIDEAAELLTATLPDLDTAEVRQRLSSPRGFVG
jgi:cell division protein FtsI (penicillin-binding protein 3)